MAASGNRKAILAALIANSGIAVAKFLGFLVTQSSAMLAEAVHSVADMSNQGLLLLGGRRSRREPTATHPFGYGRERYFWSFVVSVVLFSLGSAFAVYEGIEKVRHPSTSRQGTSTRRVSVCTSTRPAPVNSASTPASLPK